MTDDKIGLDTAGAGQSRRDLLKTGGSTLALAAIVVPSLLSSSGSGGPGASAAASELLNRAAATLEEQIPGQDEYLNVKHVDRFWLDGKEQVSHGSFEDWVPGDRSLPMIEQTTEDGRITDTTPQPMDEYESAYYRELPDPDALLDALNDAAISQDSDEGDRAENIWDQSFRELQGAAVPVEFKAAVLRALTRVDGVSAVPTSNTVGDLEGTALIFKDDPLAIVFDQDSGVFLGFSIGIDNPNADPISNQTTLTLMTRVVDSAPKPDYELE